MGIEIGSAFRFAIKKQTNAWGGLPLACGAGDGFEANSESIKANVELIMNEGLMGAAYRRAGSPGKKMPAGDIPFDLYYQDAAHRAIALVMGLDTMTNPGGVYQHDLSMVNTHAGLIATIIGAGNEGVWEWGSAKLKGFKIRWEEGKQRGETTLSLVTHDQNLNVGSPITNNIVATAAAANGVKTIAAQPTTPSPITLLLTGVTELVTTIVYTNIKGDTVTEVHTRSTGGLTYTTLQYAKTVVSITCASIAGSGNFSAGVSNGVNNATTIASVTYATQRDCSLFSQLRFYVNEQGGADFVPATDEQFLSAFEVGVDLSLDQRVTTEWGDRISEPSTGGGGWPMMTVGFSFSAETDKNRRFIYDSFGKAQLKAKAVLTGPPIAATSVAHSITVFMNALQLNEGEPDTGGPGVLAFDATGEAHSVLAVPTGFPAAMTQPGLIRIVNNLSSAII